MKLRKQAPAKGLITLASIAGLLGFWSVVKAESEPLPPLTPPPAVDYDRFFAPSARPPDAATPEPPPRPHTRTRAS